MVSWLTWTPLRTRENEVASVFLAEKGYWLLDVSFGCRFSHAKRPGVSLAGGLRGALFRGAAAAAGAPEACGAERCGAAKHGEAAARGLRGLFCMVFHRFAWCEALFRPLS